MGMTDDNVSVDFNKIKGGKVSSFQKVVNSPDVILDDGDGTRCQGRLVAIFFQYEIKPNSWENYDED